MSRPLCNSYNYIDNHTDTLPCQPQEEGLVSNWLPHLTSLLTIVEVHEKTFVNISFREVQGNVCFATTLRDTRNCIYCVCKSPARCMQNRKRNFHWAHPRTCLDSFFENTQEYTREAF